LFVEQGFRVTTAEEIAAAAGVSRRTFFLHFASKDEVLLGHIGEELDMLRAELDTSPASGEPAARAGQAVTRLAWLIQQRDDLLLQLDLLHTAPELLAVNLKQFTAFETAIADAVRIAGPRRRRLSSDEDVFAELVGTVTMAALRAGLNVWRRRGGRGQLHRLVAATCSGSARGSTRQSLSGWRPNAVDSDPAQRSRGLPPPGPRHRVCAQPDDAIAKAAGWNIRSRSRTGADSQRRAGRASTTWSSTHCSAGPPPQFPRSSRRLLDQAADVGIDDKYWACARLGETAGGTPVQAAVLGVSRDDNQDCGAILRLPAQDRGHVALAQRKGPLDAHQLGRRCGVEECLGFHVLAPLRCQGQEIR
jgi:AcrR family transcriptional regulator